MGDDTDAWDEWAGPWDYEPENNDPEAMARLCEIDPALRMNPGNVRGSRVPKEGEPTSGPAMDVSVASSVTGHLNHANRATRASDPGER